MSPTLPTRTARRRVRRAGRARRALRLVVVTGVALVVGSGLVATPGTASATPTAGTSSPSSPSSPSTPSSPSCTDTTGTAYATGLAPLPCLPSTAGTTRWTDNGQLLLPQGPANLFVGQRRLARLFTLVCTNAPTTAGFCPASVSGPVPPASTPSIIAVERIFLQSTSGAALQYGQLARVPVDAETSAGRVQGTLVLSQTSKDGVVRPVVARQSSATLTYAPGTTVAGFEQFGANPGPDRTQVSGDVAGSGPATATFTGLTLDGVAVDTGSCQAGGTLAVSARGGWSQGAAVEGGPAEYRPFAPPSYLHAKLSGATTTGCAGLDPAIRTVLTDNVDFLQQITIDFTVASVLTPYGCLTGTTPGCTAKHPAVVNAAKVPAQL